MPVPDIDALTEPFPASALKQREVQDRVFTYVDGTTVIRRLNHVCGHEWDFSIKNVQMFQTGQTDRSGNPRVLWIVTGELTIPGFGTKAGMGVQLTSLGVGEDMIKGASTDAIKNAAKLFGVGLELYGPDTEYGSGVDVDPTTGEIRSAPQQPQRVQGYQQQQRAPVQQQRQAPPQQQQRAPQQQGQQFSGVRNPTAPASEKQIKYIHDLMGNNGFDPDMFDWNNVTAGEASEWISALKGGSLPQFAQQSPN